MFVKNFYTVMCNMRLKDFIKDEWADYAKYDNERSLPSLLDGLKTSQRKIIYTYLTVLPKDSPTKVSQAGNRAAEHTEYRHGEDSIIKTLVGLAQDYPGTNNAPLLQKKGQFGTRLSGEASAARYIHASLHDNFHKFFKKEDIDVVEYLYEEGKKVEPKHYMPILPMVLINGSNGVGTGYATHIERYQVRDVVRAVRDMRRYGKVRTHLIPKPNDWKGTVNKVDKQVQYTGTYEVVNTTTIRITELPPRHDVASYRKVLNKLVDNKIIKDYDNLSTEDEWLWEIDVYRSTTQKFKHEDYLRHFDLVERITENFVGWGNDTASPLVFSTPEEVVEYWYGERIAHYQKSLEYQIEQAENALDRIGYRKAFVLWCIKNDFRKLTRAELLAVATDKLKIPEVEANKCVNIPVYAFTTDEVKKLEKELDSQKAELEELKQLTPEKMLDEDLKGV